MLVPMTRWTPHVQRAVQVPCVHCCCEKESRILQHQHFVIIVCSLSALLITELEQFPCTLREDLRSRQQGSVPHKPRYFKQYCASLLQLSIIHMTRHLGHTDLFWSQSPELCSRCPRSVVRMCFFGHWHKLDMSFRKQGNSQNNQSLLGSSLLPHGVILAALHRWRLLQSSSGSFLCLTDVKY